MDLRTTNAVIFTFIVNLDTLRGEEVEERDDDEGNDAHAYPTSLLRLRHDGFFHLGEYAGGTSSSAHVSIGFFVRVVDNLLRRR